MAELTERLKHAICTDSVGRQVIGLLVNASAYAMGMRAIAGVQLRTTVTKRNSNTNTSPNPNLNNPTYPTDPVTLLNPTISRFTSAHQQARRPAFYHLLSTYRLNPNTNGHVPNGEGIQTERRLAANPQTKPTDWVCQ